MSIFDMLLVAIVLGTFGTLLIAAMAIFRRRWSLVRGLLGGLIGLWMMYLSVGALVAVVQPQHIQPIGADRCFDEMCFAVTGFKRSPRIEGGGHYAQANGVFYIVNVRITNRSQGKAQHEKGREGMVIDQAGRIYHASAEGMRALEGAGGSFPSLESNLNPGESVLANLVFDLPPDVHQPGFTLGSSLMLYPPRVVIADDMHFLHSPTLTPLE